MLENILRFLYYWCWNAYVSGWRSWKWCSEVARIIWGRAL